MRLLRELSHPKWEIINGSLLSRYGMNTSNISIQRPELRPPALAARKAASVVPQAIRKIRIQPQPRLLAVGGFR